MGNHQSSTQGAACRDGTLLRGTSGSLFAGFEPPTIPSWSKCAAPWAGVFTCCDDEECGWQVKVGSCLTHLSAAVSFFSPKLLTRLASVHEANLDSVFEENTDSF